MLGVCFFVNEPREADNDRPTLHDWSAIRRAFNVDQMLYVDPYQPQNPHYPNLIHYNSIEDAMATTDVPWVFLEYNEDDATSLPDFNHPKDVVYCFGSDRKGLNDIDRSLGTWLSIPTSDSLYANQTAAVVLSNRQI